ncbi:unnamed protein product [Leptosia nina]|uniref:Protein SMG9 n=1 Tax=Leptosia nina TaxID=320188 RepID=A0AAV1J3E1_9NEOP
MADKKKKVIITKDSPNIATPKRPVILKSEREVKEKDKTEKEKQPTIILKTREQSTPKEDRPISPKTQAADDSHQPCKIAQNESKEKREAKPCIPLKLMSEPVKLLDESLEFNPAALEYLNDNNTNYLVVGVIGMQGVGKSLVLNLIQNISKDNICNKIINSHKMTDDTNIESQVENLNLKEKERKHDPFKFKMQNIDQIEKGVHCTKGVDMFVTSDRVILLRLPTAYGPLA